MLKRIEKCLDSTLFRLAPQIDVFQETSYSFEEWFSWECMFSLSTAGFQCDPKPRYPAEALALKRHGDLIVRNPEGKDYFIEIKLVHDYTQNKWIHEIERDREALAFVARCEGHHAIQLILLASSHKDLIATASWELWLNGLSFWQQARAIDIAYSLPRVGQAVLVGWEVTN